MTKKDSGHSNDLSGHSVFKVSCSSWNEFLEFFHNSKLKDTNDYVFRGQANENWGLEPTLKRIKLSSVEYDKNNKILECFQRYCSGKRGYNPPKLEENHWWALGQHFGLHTPLLDWSESPYVAAFFAFRGLADLEENEWPENVAIWALFRYVNKLDCIDRLDKEKHHLLFFYPNMDENYRLINQRGLFVKSPDMMCIKEWVISNVVGGTDKMVLTKVVIPSTEVYVALDSLDRMNINEFTLFPDLTGAAKYSNYVAGKNNGR